VKTQKPFAKITLFSWSFQLINALDLVAATETAGKAAFLSKVINHKASSFQRNIRG
jgi:hypothetical protein